MQKGVIAALIAVGAVIAVALTVTLVLTLPEDEPKPQLDKAVAKVNQGPMIGAMSKEAGMFLGIPFSKPPVGDLRWKNPVEPDPFVDVWDATHPRPGCIQICHLPAEEYSCPIEISEDCLYLNVWVPRRLMKQIGSDDIIEGRHYVVDDKYQNGDLTSLAVMVFFYGGNFIVGDGGVALYDGRFIVDQGDVIAVSTNYRVGPLGFLVQGQDDPNAAIGNYGIWDQVKTLEWVRDNIKYFGGNPDRVTVYGQSAGAESIGVFMTSPYLMNRGLFHQTIMESNPFALPFRNRDNAEEYGMLFTEAAGCVKHDMECLRKADIDTILEAYKETTLSVVGVEKLFLIFQPWGPVIDGDFLPEQPVDAFGKGNMLQVPSVFGVVAHEAESYIHEAFTREVSNTEYRAVVNAIMKEDADPVIDRYPPACPAPGINCDNRELMSTLTTWFLFVCPTRYSLNRMEVDTYYYYFNQTWSFYKLWGMEACNFKVCHAAELPYVFNIANLTAYDFDPQEDVLADRMVFYWTNFAKYGNPNGDISKGHSASNDRQNTRDANSVNAVYWPKFRETGTEDYFALQIAASGDYELKNLFDSDCNFCDDLDSYADHFKL